MSARLMGVQTPCSQGSADQFRPARPNDARQVLCAGVAFQLLQNRPLHLSSEVFRGQGNLAWEIQAPGAEVTDPAGPGLPAGPATGAGILRLRSFRFSPGSGSP